MSRGWFDARTQRILGAECIFKMAVRSLVAQARYPSPRRCHEELTVLTGRPCHGDLHNINGRQCRWRDEALAEYPEGHWVNVEWRKRSRRYGPMAAWLDAQAEAAARRHITVRVK